MTLFLSVVYKTVQKNVVNLFLILNFASDLEIVHACDSLGSLFVT